MPARVRPWIVCCWILASTTVGCASGPSLQRVVTVQEGEPTRVAMRQGPLRLTMQNASAGLPEDVYKDVKDPNLKVVPDGELQGLLDVFAESHLFEHAAGVAGNPADSLLIEQGNRIWSWSRPSNREPGPKADYLQCCQYFLAIYNGNVAFHGSDDRPNFSSAKSRAETDAAAARERLLKLRQEQKR